MSVQDVSAFGIIVNLVASNTFPQGITLTQWGDDADPVDSPSIKIGDAAVGVNGDLIVWSKGVPLPMTLNCVPGSDDDQNLSILAEANRVGQGKTSARDLITATIIYPNGEQVTLDTGKITDAMMAGSAASSGRLKTKTYGFVFQNRSGGVS